MFSPQQPQQQQPLTTNNNNMKEKKHLDEQPEQAATSPEAEEQQPAQRERLVRFPDVPVTSVRIFELPLEGRSEWFYIEQEVEQFKREQQMEIYQLFQRQRREQEWLLAKARGMPDKVHPASSSSSAAARRRQQQSRRRRNSYQNPPKGVALAA